MTIERDIETAWGRIERWLEENAKETLAALNEPASPDEIAAAQQEIGVELPTQLRSCLQRHNGSEGNLAGKWQLISTDLLGQEWSTNMEVAEEFDGDEDPPWRAAWLPFASDGAGNFLLVDGEGGAVRLANVEDMDRPVVAVSLVQWLADLAHDLEQGCYPVVGARISPDVMVAASGQCRHWLGQASD